jgi:hypothetical protein
MAARDDLKAILDEYGLGALFARLDQVIQDDPTLVNSAPVLLSTVRDTPEYKQRFKGNEARRAKGLPELSPFDYVARENEYRQTLRATSMPRGFYDSESDFANFIGNDVRADELEARITQGYSAVMDAEPATKEELKRLYGLQDADIAAFFIDPERFNRSEAMRKAQSAQIAAEARRQAGITVDAQQAEALAREGVSREMAQAGFAQIGEQQGLFQAQMAGEEQVSQAEQIGATFGTNAQARQAITQRRRRRQAAFEAGGGFAGQGGAQATGLTTVGE